MELWDAYDTKGCRVPGTLVRGEAVPDGLCHLACEVLVRNADGRILLMHRVATKADFPGYWEASAGGSALSGEDSLACVRRELQEETGIDRAEFIYLGRHIYPEYHTIFDNYLALTDIAPNAIICQKGETDAYRWLKAEEFSAFAQSQAAIPPQMERTRSHWEDILQAGADPA